MKLLSIQVFPLGPSGWHSDTLEFGNEITQLYGPNGSGKTPLVQSIGYCLGYPSIFRNDIYEQCSHAVLRGSTEKGELTIKRTYSRDVDIEVTEPSGSIQRFYSEKEYSLYLLDWLDLTTTNLVGSNNRSTTPYLSTTLPIFYLDQDTGYGSYYQPPNNFIKDQFSEMMRMIFKLPPRNSFDAKKHKIHAKDQLDFKDKQVEEFRRKLETAKSSPRETTKTLSELDDEISTLEAELRSLRDSGASHDESIAVFDRLIASHKSTIRELTDEIQEIKKRGKCVAQIIGEINVEINTLNLNEQAKRVFLSFDEICGSENCQLFSSSSESYGKNLLYLKDQIKDLERNAETDAIKEEQLLSQVKNLENIVSSVVDERNSALEKSDIAALVDAISEIKNRAYELQVQRSELKTIEDMEKRYVELLSDRQKAYDTYIAYSSSTSSNPEIIKLRADLRSLFIKWLDLIHTSNISRDITFKDDFIPILGRETISQLKGSTRIRAVLAYHAAVIELMGQNDSLSFRFLILDTPKQHEIHNDDLDNYIKELKKLCSSRNIQVVFSTTEYHYVGNEKDKEWNPIHPGIDQKMYLARMT